MNGVDQTSFTDLMSQQRQLPLRGAKTVNGGEISDSTLAQLARRVGPQRMLNAAIAAERSALQLFKLPPAHSNGHSNGQSVISVEHPL
jgi:hypothetical protein